MVEHDLLIVHELWLRDGCLGRRWATDCDLAGLSDDALLGVGVLHPRISRVVPLDCLDVADGLATVRALVVQVVLEGDLDGAGADEVHVFGLLDHPGVALLAEPFQQVSL
eukprot:10615039-Alexandrium_andersonii.AAC.2